MCNLSKGIKERILSSIQNLMESMGWSWSTEQVMSALKILESERIQYVDGLKK